MNKQKAEKMSNKKSKTYMWYKVRELQNQGFNKSQISRETGLDRATVRKYMSMSESAFQNWVKESFSRPVKLESYTSFVKQELGRFPGFSAAQIEDHLKEHHPNFPAIHSKTVYNFVQSIREKYNIPKPKISQERIFEQLPPTPYGEQAQVDFGETWMQTATGKRKKVYFFAMLLSRSRYKFIYLINKPFTTQEAIKGHEHAFEYFEGVPNKIIYDQDCVFIHDENLGDYQLTHKFQQYCNTQDFEVIFCRKADPQSKGKVENVVKYVKQNFLRGRKYTDIHILNEEGKSWLDRTGNAKVHGVTQKKPKEEWLQEKKYLLPLKQQTRNQPDEKVAYKLRKDNTVAYRGNFYSLPAGTYKGKHTEVLLEITQEDLRLYSSENELIAIHKISVGKGQLIRNTDHAREKSKTIEEYRKKVIQLLGSSQTSNLFVELLQKDKPRYFRDNLQYITQELENSSSDSIEESLSFCIENKLFNAKNLVAVIRNKDLEADRKKQADKTVSQMSVPADQSYVHSQASTDVAVSKIDNYEKIFTSCPSN